MNKKLHFSGSRHFMGSILGLAFISLTAAILPEAVHAQSTPTTLSWTDTDLKPAGKPITITPTHVRELRRAAQNKRGLCSLSSPASIWGASELTIVPKSTPVKAQHLTRIREAIKEVYDLAPARPLPLVYSNASLDIGDVIQINDVYELREVIKNATCCGNGICEEGYETIANCLQDCGGCQYGNWEYFPCGDSGCFETEVFRKKNVAQGPYPGCPTISECVSNFDLCCAYNSWQFDSCGGAPCDPTTERQKRTSATAGCPAQYQCGAGNSCCDYAGFNAGQCGFTSTDFPFINRPDTTWVEVNIPDNRACVPQLQGEIAFADQCCHYGAAVENCGGTVDSTSYDNSYYISQRTPTNTDCPVDTTIVQDSDNCCGYGPEVIRCGGTFRVQGNQTTYPDTTYLKIRIPTNPNCNIKIVENIPYSDNDPAPYCCGYSGFLGSCGYSNGTITYPSNTWIEVNAPTNPNCPVRTRNIIPDDNFCCNYTTTSGCGQGSTQTIGAAPMTDWITKQTPSNPACNFKAEINYFHNNCCSYPAIDSSQCGYDKPNNTNRTYDNTYMVTYNEPSNPNCPNRVTGAWGPYNTTCCDWRATGPGQCGPANLKVLNQDNMIQTITIGEFDYVSALQIPQNNNCHVLYSGIDWDSDLCCGYTSSSSCGDGVTYPVIDSIVTQIPLAGKNPVRCPTIIDSHVVEGCCGYPTNPDYSFRADRQCGGTFNTSTGVVVHPASTLVMYLHPTNNLCFDKIISTSPNDDFCCSYGAWSNDRCGYPGFHPDTTQLKVSLPGAGFCDPKFKDVSAKTDLCCDYVGHYYSACGAHGRPDSTMVTWKESPTKPGDCPVVVTAEEPNSATCCNYGAPVNGCGGTPGFEGHPSTHYMTKRAPGTGANPSCTTLIVDNGFDATNCCGYGAVTYSCGGSGNFAGYSNRDYIGLKLASNPDPACTPVFISKSVDDPVCCGYSGSYTDRCGFTGTYGGTIWDQPTHTFLSTDIPSTNSNCPLRYKNRAGNTGVNVFDEMCCSYSAWSWTCGCSNCEPYHTSNNPASTGNVTYNDTYYLEKRTSSNSCASPQVRNASAANDERCCHWETSLAPDEDWGCGATRYGKTCAFGDRLLAYFPSNPNCTPNPYTECKADASCLACNAGDKVACSPVSGCPYERVCSSGVWSNCQPVSLCAPGGIQDYADHCGDGTQSGYIYHQTCNSCGSGWGTCYCIPQTDTSPCTTGGGCPGISSCADGTSYGACMQTNPVCEPGTVLPGCTLASDGSDGVQYCNACGTVWDSQCRCMTGTFTSCTTAAGCDFGARICNSGTGEWSATCLAPGAACTANTTRDCDPDGAGPKSATDGTQTCRPCQTGWTACTQK